jgi:hypothetical protein
MICNDALELLIDADLDELAGQGGSPLAVHVRDCARCRAVAAQLALDTQALGRALEPDAVRVQPLGARRQVAGARRMVPRGVVAAGAMAAGLGLVVLAVRPGGDLRRTTASGRATAPPPAVLIASAPSPGSRQSTVDVVAGPKARFAKSAPTARRSLGTLATARRFADPVPATPVKLVASQSVAARATGDPGGVTVTAPQGTRVAVLKTGSATITVVWLY